MSESVDYLISGVWKDSNDRITYVMLHSLMDGNTLNMGVKTSESETIKLLKQNKTISTVVWNYPGWEIESGVSYYTRDNKEYLRSESNATTNDNLDNLISMKIIK